MQLGVSATDPKRTLVRDVAEHQTAAEKGTAR